MIQYIKGELAAIGKDQAIVDVDGVGFGIFMSPANLDALPPIGEEVKIHTYLQVKEDDLQLYGFLTRDDLEVFQLLIGVSGIGPKGALGILSQLNGDDLRFAVLSGDAKTIAAAPGIGKKTAEKVILELKDKLKIEDVLTRSASGEGAASVGAATDSQVVSDAVQALTSLGYASTEAMRAVRSVEGASELSVNEVLKQALKNLSM